MTITIKSNLYHSGANQDEFSARNYVGAPKVSKTTGIAASIAKINPLRVIVLPLVDGALTHAVYVTPEQLNPPGVRSVGYTFLKAIEGVIKWGAPIQYFGKSA